MKKETLEEAAANYGWRIKKNTFSDAVKANELAESAQQDFIAGAKYQAERMYSEEDVKTLIDIINWYDENSDVCPNFEIPEIKKSVALIDWFVDFEEQFKKK